MDKELKSKKWDDAVKKMQACHLSLLNPEVAKSADWKEAFNALVKAIKEERSYNPAFAPELSDLDEATENTYGFYDILEEYFDFLEEKEDWDDVIESAEEMISLFKWEKKLPSEYMFRKGNALEKLGLVKCPICKIKYGTQSFNCGCHMKVCENCFNDNVYVFKYNQCPGCGMPYNPIKSKKRKKSNNDNLEK
jgi:hypothetical protein